MTLLKANSLVQNALRETGVAEGDILLVHSDITPMIHLGGFAWIDQAPKTLLDCFLDLIGPDGTLIVPTFNYDFCKGKGYCHETTPSQVGVFSNYLLKDSRAVRSFHPIFSFAAIGREASELMGNVPKSSFGEGSVFHRLHLQNAKQVFFNTDFYYCTFIHYVEQCVGVDYRFLKQFTGNVKIGRSEYTDTFDFYARYLDRNIVLDMTRLEKDLFSQGHMKKTLVDRKFPILQVRCGDVYQEAARKLKTDPYYLLKQPPLSVPS